MKTKKSKFTVLLSDGEKKMLEELSSKELGMSAAMYLRSTIRRLHRKKFGVQPKLVP